MLNCEREEHIENDKNAVAVIWDDFVSKKAVGHIPLKWSKVAFRGGKGVNRGVRLVFEILVHCFFMQMQEL